MKPTAAITNSLWIASSLPAWRRFRNALQRPAEVQQEWLRHHLTRNAGSQFAREHKLATAQSYEEFSARVPLQDYESLEPWIKRLQCGEPRILTSETVTHLIPTSGSTGARKLIPFTAGLQRDFDCAIAPWICDLARQQPGIIGGPAYWSITPSSSDASSQQGKRDALVANFDGFTQPAPGAAQPPCGDEASRPPIGFADDASYLGGVKGWLVRAALVRPNEPLPAADLDAFHRATLLALLRERELRLISVWHPSFLTLLLAALPTNWNTLLTNIARNDPQRARELERANPVQPETLWPELRVISCWGNAHAEFGFAELQRRFPRSHIEPKGLLATEAFVTIPFAGKHPLAVRSHFFEFADESGRIQLAHELCEGETYEVIVTTSGGLWRYRLGDLVRVTGFWGATPTLQFLGRTGNVSDLRGEKLSEPFVAAAIQRVAARLGQPGFAMLAPETTAEAPPHYTLFFSGAGATAPWQTQLETELRRNPHYDYCRQLGQLAKLTVCEVGPDAGEIFLRHEAAFGKRLGEVKSTYLSKRTGWSAVFRESLSVA
jgi:hypothetical protein